MLSPCILYCGASSAWSPIPNSQQNISLVYHIAITLLHTVRCILCLKQGFPVALFCNLEVRGYIYRFRQAFSLICDYPLIESTPNGYRLNPNLSIITDVQQFDRLVEAARQSSSEFQKINLMKKAVKLYRGAMFRGAQDEHWIISQVNLYRLRYVSLVNDLLRALAETQDYACVQHYALNAAELMPGNLKAHYWLVVSTYHLGSIALAKNELLRAKEILTSEEYTILEDYLRKSEDVSWEKLIK